MADLMNTDVALVAKDHLVAFLGIGLKKNRFEKDYRKYIYCKYLHISNE
jgi:hypothetical protein